MDFWQNVDSIRKCSLKQLSIDTGLSYQKIRDQRACGRLPSLEDAYAIAKALGATVEKLLTGKNASDFPEGINIIAEKSLSAELDDIRMINAILGIDREPYILSYPFNDWF